MSVHDQPDATGSTVDAIVYVPGLGRSSFMAGSHVAQLILWEFNQRAVDAKACFAMEPVEGGPTSVLRVRRTDESGSFDVVDIHQLDIRSRLKEATGPKGKVGRVLTTAATTVVAVAAVTRALMTRRGSTKRPKEILQLLFCMFVCLCLFAYLVVAALGLIESVLVLLKQDGTPTVGVLQWTAMIGGLLIALMPNALTQLLDFTEDSTQMMRYLWNATLRDHLAGNLQTVIDEIVKDPRVRRIHLVGFSFGSLVVLDTTFPIGVVAAPALGRVTTVTTVGCPLDMLTMMVPHYPRHRTVGRDPRWINIYHPLDVLGSDFKAAVGESSWREASAIGSLGRIPDENYVYPAPRSLTLGGFLMLWSVKAHAEYWGEAVNARSALGLVVQSLFANTRALL